MTRAAIIVISCLLTLPVRAEVIDRVVATVNGRPILQSDVDETVRYDALVEDKPVSAISAADAEATLQHLTDQELIRQQMGEMPVELDKDVLQAKLAEVREQHAKTPEQWRERLKAYGLTDEEFTRLLQNQLETMAYIDHRLRPSIVIDRAAVETYYRDTFLPELHKRGVSKDPPYADVQQQIREVLTQQRINETLTAWLRNLRQQSRVRILVDGAQVAKKTPGATTK
jgi:SurA N-terminal domain